MDNDTGERIKQLRKQKGLTQKEFCERINAKQSKISYIERGTNEPGIEIIKTICKAFNISADWFYLEIKMKTQQISRRKRIFQNSSKKS